MSAIPSTHKAIAMPGPRQPLTVIDVPTLPPKEDEVLVQVKWTGSSPLDLHQADGGLGTTPNQTPGDTFAGLVAALGPNVTSLKVGDRVFGFAHEEPHHRAQQEYVTVPAYRVSRVPGEMPLSAAATVSSSLVTVFHAVTADLGLELPWPIPQDWRSKNADAPILIWGGAGSVGMFALQVLRHWGYKNIIAVASSRHHAHLKDLGATATFDYGDGDVTDKILAYVGDNGAAPRVPFILDCIGILHGTLEPISRVAESGSRVAILLPVIVRDATETEAPIYEGDVSKCLEGKWAEGVALRGVRTHFYARVSFINPGLECGSYC